MRSPTRRFLRRLIGEDGTEHVWPRLTDTSWEVVRLAREEARTFGHPCLADEHLLLGILRHADNDAAVVLRRAGFDLAAARAELARVGPSLGRQGDPVSALQTLGIDVEQVRVSLEARFGVEAVRAAQRQVRRRPRWRGGRPRPSALCGHMLGKRALEMAAEYARARGDAGVEPRHLLHGVLQDAQDPLGTQLSRRSRRQLRARGFAAGRPNPVRLQLEARGLDLRRLASDLDSA
jgi:ATP-dependent Clp protease ATP-binding subunit ClpA